MVHGLVCVCVCVWLCCVAVCVCGGRLLCAANVLAHSAARTLVRRRASLALHSRLYASLLISHFQLGSGVDSVPLPRYPLSRCLVLVLRPPLTPESLCLCLLPRSWCLSQSHLPRRAPLPRSPPLSPECRPSSLASLCRAEPPWISWDSDPKRILDEDVVVLLAVLGERGIVGHAALFSCCDVGAPHTAAAQIVGAVRAR
jgi:hypothetical protein